MTVPSDSVTTGAAHTGLNRYEQCEHLSIVTVKFPSDTLPQHFLCTPCISTELSTLVVKLAVSFL